MRNLIIATFVACVGVTTAQAGALERTNQNLDILFAPGGQVELTFGLGVPELSGSIDSGLYTSGNISPRYQQTGLAAKVDIGRRFGLALIYGQPWGTAVAYPAGNSRFAYSGTTVLVSSQALTAVGRFRISKQFAVHAGLRRETLGIDAVIPYQSYTLNVTGDGGMGYLLGGSFEIPPAGLRTTITYFSAITQNMSGTENGRAANFAVTTPQALNLDFKTGIAPDTSLYASVRWVDWSSTEITPTRYQNANGAPLYSYSSDIVTYAVGVGRRFSNNLAATVLLGMEAPVGGQVSNLWPADGNAFVQLGGEYNAGSMTVKGTLRYTKLGGGTAQGTNAVFDDHRALELAIGVGYRF